MSVLREHIIFHRAYCKHIVLYIGDGIYEDSEKKNNNNILTEHGLEGPLTQYIVTNCDLVRVRYLLVYAKQPASMRFPTTSVNRNCELI